MRTIAVTNQKGGCGKTTTAINVAAGLVAKGYRTLLIDLDPQTHASLGLGVRTDALQSTVYHVLSDAVDRRLAMSDVIRRVSGDVDLAPGHILLSTLEQELMGTEDGISRLYHAVESLQSTYQFVLIDTPPNLGFLTFNALRASTEVLVPVEAATYALSGVAKLFNMIDLLRVKTDHRHRSVKAAVCLFDRRSSYARKTLGLVRSTFNYQVYNSLIGLNSAVREAISAGQPVRVYNKYASAALAYDALAGEILHDPAAFDTERFFAEAASIVRRVTLSLRQPQALAVHLVGDFNDWTVDDHSLCERLSEGRWGRPLDLSPGRYRYQFVVDGCWMPDPANTHTERNPFGSVDSVLVIE